MYKTLTDTLAGEGKASGDSSFSREALIHS